MAENGVPYTQVSHQGEVSWKGDSNPELRHPTVTASVTVLKPLCQPVTQTPSAGPGHSTLHILKCTALILVATRIHTLAIVKNKPAKTKLTNREINP